VRFFDSTDETASSLSGTSLLNTIMDTYRKDFIVQQHVQQHESLSRLHASSVNTIRVTTYILEGRVYATPLFLRVGRGNNQVDNIGAGGISIGISDDGLLDEVGFSRKQDIYFQHPDSGVTFNGYHIPNVRKMIEVATKLHGRIPHTGIISWDVTLDSDGNIVVIEHNIKCPGITVMQYHGKSVFGENTPKMIALCRKRKSDGSYKGTTTVSN